MPLIFEKKNRQTRKYLEFITSTNKCKSKFDSDPFSSSAEGDIVYKILGIDEKTNPNIILSTGKKPDDIKLTEVNSQIAQDDDFEQLKFLLRQEDLRGEPSIAGLKKKMKRIRKTSKNLLTRQMSSLKSKLSSESQENYDAADTESLQKQTEIILYSAPSSIRSSVADIGSGIIKRVKRNKPKYQRSSTEGVGMTALLVRTLMTAPSLDSIAEHTDSNNDLPLTTPLRKKSESLVDLPRKLAAENRLLKAPNISESSNEMKASDSNLSSNYSMSSMTMTSSSDEDDESNSPRRKEVVLIDADTISMVVKSVLAQEESEMDDYSWIKPSSYDSELNEMGLDDSASAILDRKRLTRQASFEYRHSTEDLHNIMKSGATHVLRTSKKEKNPKTILVEHKHNQEEIENLFSSNPMDDDEQNWIQPGSTADEPEISEVEHSSMLHDLKENITDTIHNIQEHMHHPKSHHEMKQHGLLSNAMENILLEQASLLGVQSSIFLPDLEDSKLEPKKRSSSMDSLKRILGSPFRRRSNESTSELNMKKGNLKNTSGLVDSAMKTMLMGTANIIEGVGAHPTDNRTKTEPEKKRLQTIYSKSGDDSKSSKDSKSVEEDKPTEETVEARPLGEQAEESALESESDKNLALVVTLTKAGPDPANNKSNRLQAPPVVILTKETKSPHMKHRKIPKSPIPSKTNLMSQLSVSHSELLTISNHNPSKTNRKLISVSNCDLLNITNKTALLAPKPYHPHARSNDVIASPGKCVLTTGSNTASGVGHIRAESFGSKIPPNSPVKVTSSATSANITNSTVESNATATSTTATATTMITSKDKDGKENKDTIFRRSSDSDLSVTPKGMF